MNLPNVSLLTIVRGRRAHLHNLLRGVRRMTDHPLELIIIFMNEDVPTDLPQAGTVLVTERLDDPDPLPLARARNRAAELARGEVLLFLDVDCIPGENYARDLAGFVRQSEGLVMGDAHYLPRDSQRNDWTEKDLDKAAEPHPRRPHLDTGELRPTDQYHLFWSLTFGCYATTFQKIGGFDESYVGYGGEDTDFAFRARRAGVPFFLADARCYHQHHSTCTPPVNNLENIVTNSRLFHEKWGAWPMEGWLAAFRSMGLVEWTEEDLRLLRLPTAAEVEAHRSEDPFA